jgi:hypothetical protein
MTVVAYRRAVDDRYTRLRARVLLEKRDGGGEPRRAMADDHEIPYSCEGRIDVIHRGLTLVGRTARSCHSGRGVVAADEVRSAIM